MKLLLRVPVALRLLLLGSGLLSLVPAASPQSNPGLLTTTEPPAMVRSVRGLSENNGQAIEIISDHPVVPQIRKLDNPPRLVIDLPNTTLSSNKKHPDFRSAEV